MVKAFYISEDKTIKCIIFRATNAYSNIIDNLDIKLVI